MHSIPNIHILGIQGSGKGTQAAKLVERYSLTYVASGNLFRERARVDDELGHQIADWFKKGVLFPDELLVSTVDNFLETAPIKNGILCDGVMRTSIQQALLASVWEKHQLDQPFMINLVLSDEDAVKRIEHRKKEAEAGINTEHHKVFSGKLLQRTDDNPIAIQERIRLFHSMTQPVISHFQSLGLYIDIDASQSIDIIHTEICRNLEKHFPSLSHVTD